MRMYVEQQEVLESMRNHLQNASAVPLIMSGIEGSGKSTNASRMVKMIEDECKIDLQGVDLNFLVEFLTG